MKQRPQWLTVHTACGSDVSMRLPPCPDVQDVKNMLDRINEVAEERTREMQEGRAAQPRGWSLTQGPPVKAAPKRLS